MNVHLVLMPGLDGTGDLFGPLVEALGGEPKATILRYPRDHALGYEELLPTVLDALPKRDPFVLVAESFSGPLALMAAARKPRGLVGVALVATFVSSPLWWAGAWASPLVRPFAFRRTMPALVLRRALADRSAPDALIAAVIAATASVRPEVMAARVRAVLTVDAREALASCDVPLVYLRGSRDRLVGRRASEAMLTLRPDLEIVDVDAPHLVLQTQPVACARTLALYCRKLVAT
jgi:pimeloyl-ACP methyl ester carboxylesterase